MLENLYKALYKDERYTNSYEEFQTKFEDPAYREKVYKNVLETGEYTNMFTDFEKKYYNQSVVEEVVADEEVSNIQTLDASSTATNNKEVLNKYLTQLQEINISEEELDDIIERSGVDGELVFAPKAGDGSLQKFEETVSFVYDDFLNADKTNHAEAQQRWVEQEKTKLIESKADKILESYESQEMPLWQDFKQLIKTNPTQAEINYEAGKDYLYQEFNKKYKESEKVIVKSQNNLKLLTETIVSIDENIDAIQNSYNKNKSNLTQGDVDNFNKLIQTRESLTYHCR